MAQELDVVFLADHLGYLTGAHGVTTYCRTVFPELVRRGLRFRSVFLGKHHAAAESLETGGVDVQFLGSSKEDLRVLVKVVNLLKQLSPRVVHVTQQKSTAVARLLAPYLGFEVVAHLHDFEATPRGLKLAAAMSATPARMLCVTSSLIPVATEEYGVPPERCAVLPNGLDLSPFKSIDPRDRARVRTEFNIPADVPLLGMAVRLDADKRPQTFVRDARRMLARCPDLHFLVAGDGTERVACEQLAEELGLTARMRFVGFRSDVRSIISACDAMALYSLVEACPYAAIEALALGKPVLGFDAGGMREIVRHASTGFLAVPTHADQIVEYAVQLATNPTLRSSMSAECVRDSQRFSIERHVDSLLRHYDDASANA